MIFVRDKGQLCNNILQYGHLYAWGKEHCVRTVSMRFAYKYQYFKICDAPLHNFFVYVLVKYAAKLHFLPIVSFHVENEKIDEKEKIMQKSAFVLAEGWYARFYDLFLKYKNEIIDLFSFKDEIVKHVDHFINQFSQSGDILLGVHVRRGDYKTWMSGRYYYDDSVYVRFIQQFVSLFPNRHVIVFVCGNDSTLDCEYYCNHLTPTQVLFPKGNAGEDLCLLSKCDYLIGAPSTFSLVASMYCNIPTYWIENFNDYLNIHSFNSFEQLFRNIK